MTSPMTFTALWAFGRVLYRFIDRLIYFFGCLVYLFAGAFRRSFFPGCFLKILDRLVRLLPGSLHGTLALTAAERGHKEPGT